MIYYAVSFASQLLIVCGGGKREAVAIPFVPVKCINCSWLWKRCRYMNSYSPNLAVIDGGERERGATPLTSVLDKF